ncbi:MAG: hypothetical protein ACK55I_30365, partial [bacterium]
IRPAAARVGHHARADSAGVLRDGGGVRAGRVGQRGTGGAAPEERPAGGCGCDGRRLAGRDAIEVLGVRRAAEGHRRRLGRRIGDENEHGQKHAAHHHSWILGSAQAGETHGKSFRERGCTERPRSGYTSQKVRQRSPAEM